MFIWPCFNIEGTPNSASTKGKKFCGTLPIYRYCVWNGIRCMTSIQDNFVHLVIWFYTRTFFHFHEISFHNHTNDHFPDLVLPSTFPIHVSCPKYPSTFPTASPSFEAAKTSCQDVSSPSCPDTTNFSSTLTNSIGNAEN